MNMKASEFAEKYLGIMLHEYQKYICDQMESMCNNCKHPKRFVCKTYGGYCNKWKRLKDKNNFIGFLLYKSEMDGDNHD